MKNSDNPFRNLPAVNDILQAPGIMALEHRHAHDVIVAAIRDELAEIRSQLGQGQSLNGELSVEMVAAHVEARLTRDLRPRLRSVINATGIVLHTNLGRAPIAEEAAKAAYEAARGYLNLELDLEPGTRSSRQNPIRACTSKWVCFAW